jgi:hypothetical protein
MTNPQQLSQKELPLMLNISYNIPGLPDRKTIVVGLARYSAMLAESLEAVHATNIRVKCIPHKKPVG